MKPNAVMKPNAIMQQEHDQPGLRRILLVLCVVAAWPLACDCDQEPIDQIRCDFEVRARAGAEIDFGEVEVNRDERRGSLVIENIGNRPLNALDFSFTGNADQYDVEVPDGFTVSPGEDESLIVVFRPTQETILNAELNISHPRLGASNCPVRTLVLRGEGVAPLPVDSGVDAGAQDGGFFVDGGVRDAGFIETPDSGVVLEPDAEWRAYGGFEDARAGFATITLVDGAVLAVGGYGENGVVLDSIERFDPVSGTSRIVARLAVPRAWPGVAQLPDGRVVIAGGRSQRVGGVAVRTVEIFNPANDQVACPNGVDACGLDDNDAAVWPVGRVAPLVLPAGPDSVAILLGRAVAVDGSEQALGGGELVGLGTPLTKSAIAAGLFARTGEARVLGPDGDVLLIGGRDVDGIPLVSVSRYDGATRNGSDLASLPAARTDVGAALLSDGSVIVVGGVDGGGDLPDDVLIVANAFVGTIEITPATVTVARRARPLVAVLPDDLVLIAGGAPANPTGRPDDESVLPRLDAEILVPIASTFLRFAPDNDLAQGRIDGASVVVGADGDEVLLLGGMATTPRVTPQPHAEKYELATNRFFSFGLMGPGTALTPGVVAGSGAALLSVGGIDPHGGRTSDIVRAFDAENGEFLLAGSLSSPRRDHTATSLAADLIVVIGGRDDSGAIIGSASVFNTVSGEDSPLPVGLARPRALHTATLLAPDNPHGAGAVLLCGGVGQGGEPLDTCEVFVPPSDLRDPLTYGSARFVFVGSRMATGRVGHSVTLLDTGEVLLVGGGDVENRQVRADLFVPDAVDPTLRPTGQPARARTGHAAVLMGGGHVLLVGGNTVDGSFGPTRTAEVYSRETEVFVEVEEMERPRSAPAAFLLADGQVLVSGGTRALGEPDYPFVSNVESELYSPGGDGVGTFELIDVPLSYGRSDLLAVEVFGRAIVAGGTHRDGTLVTGDERQTPQHFVDMLVDPTPDP